MTRRERCFRPNAIGCGPNAPSRATVKFQELGLSSAYPLSLEPEPALTVSRWGGGG